MFIVRTDMNIKQRIKSWGLGVLYLVHNIIYVASFCYIVTGLGLWVAKHEING